MKSIVFDLDGTLVHSAPDIHSAANHLLRHEGCEEIDLATLVSFVGNGLPKLTDRVMKVRGIAETEFHRCYKIISEYYASHSTDLTRPYKGVESALVGLRKSGYRLGICTNKPELPTRSILNKLELMQYFEVVIAGDSTPVKKPDPKPLLLAQAQLGGGVCLFVGDSEVDAQTAKNAKLDFALFTEGYRKTPLSEFPSKIQFSSFEMLSEIVTKWVSNRLTADFV